MWEALSGFVGGVALEGRKLSSLSYADDIILTAGTRGLHGPGAPRAVLGPKVK